VFEDASSSHRIRPPRGVTVTLSGAVARRAREHGVPTIALAGTIGERARVNYDAGIASFDSILDAPCPLSEAIEQAPRLLRHCAERVMRMVLVGVRLDQLPREDMPARPFAHDCALGRGKSAIAPS
jgi:glycerate 2-kinase